MNEYAEALPYFQKTLLIKERITNNAEMDEDLNLTLKNVGQCLVKLGRDVEGQEYLERYRLIDERVAETNKQSTLCRDN